MMLALIASVALAFACAWAVMSPHFCEELGTLEGANSDQELIDRKERIVQIIKDLDLDFTTGKLAGAEYDRMRSSLTAELGTLLTQIDGTSSNK